MAFFSSASGSSSSSSSESNLATAKTILSAAASLAATAMVVRSVVNDFLPSDVMEEYLYAGIRKMFRQFSSELTMVIEEFDGLTNNQVYEAAQTYLGKKISPSNRRLKVSKPDSEKDFMVTMAPDEEILDVFEGIKFHWVMICKEVESKSLHNRRNNNSTLVSEVRSLELSFHNKHKDMVLKRYLPFILKEAKSIKQEAKALRIFTMDYVAMYRNPKNAWAGTNLDHPATFDTLALDSKMKEFVLEDLKRFLKRKDYYKKIGKAWKRGYLLYGPPGTGKSSLIAAMANFLHFDIYDLELTEIECNSDLRRLLIGMPNRSILVVEDIDCTIELENRSGESKPSSSSTDDSQETKVTLSGLLNFIDGLWSSCGDERIIVFTTNHKEKLDPALLRPGRMDVHIHMSYCTPCGFRQLARNYLGPQTQHHTLFPEIEHAILVTKVTPAEVAEELLKGNDNDAILKGLLDFLKRKKIDNDELEVKKRNEVEAAAHSQDKEKQQEAHTEDNDENK